MKYVWEMSECKKETKKQRKKWSLSNSKVGKRNEERIRKEEGEVRN
jgi:hypothetical protein